MPPSSDLAKDRQGLQKGKEESEIWKKEAISDDGQARLLPIQAKTNSRNPHTSSGGRTVLQCAVTSR